jgi:biopolymer transport protein ExbD
MKFPRNARIFRGQLDAAPFASVFFLLLIFVLVGSQLHTPGVRLELPSADDLPGTDRPTIAVAVDKQGQYYFQNRQVGQAELEQRLQEAAGRSAEPLTLVVQADKEVTEEKLVALALLARNARIHDLLLATLPRLFTNAAPAGPTGPP